MALPTPVHSFHIPVMGTGFTIDTPLKVARYGISSVVSLVDDRLIEQMRQKVSGALGRAYEAIAERDDDARARRITAYLDLMHDEVQAQMARMKAMAFEAGNELSTYFEMLPTSPLRSLYETMQSMSDPEQRARLQDELRARLTPGTIDVNIMTKLDRERLRAGQSLGPRFSDAMTALKGFAESKLESSVILSAGMNAKLYGYLAEFQDFLPDDAGELRKTIVLKVSDFRSALVQGRMLARKGLWVSEFRIESGLNCGGHAFGGRGQLLGPILQEFHDKRAELTGQLHEACGKGLQALGRDVMPVPPPQRVTVQGGIGTSDENAMLAAQYGVDGTGWASPFLLVPEVVSIDEDHLARLEAAREDDVHLSNASPLGVPFWCLKTSESERARLERIAAENPGSGCPKGYLAFNTEFTKKPICTASRAYQKLKLKALNVLPGAAPAEVTDKACICHDLAGGATKPLGIDPEAKTAVCCGPNTVYFSARTSLREMIDHIYGRARLPLDSERPHMFIKELSLHVQRLREEMADRRQELSDKGQAAADSVAETRDNLMLGVRYYRERLGELAGEQRDRFAGQLESLREEIERLLPGESS
ncbi:MAG TPA: hypothetical protein PLH84_14365 [Candidatus Krumholzibacteria bacterium]|nr:hypothetical protein [Candidatus Krumholzibacteria bacterium]